MMLTKKNIAKKYSVFFEKPGISMPSQIVISKEVLEEVVAFKKDKPSNGIFAPIDRFSRQYLLIQTLKSLFPSYAHGIESSWAPIYSATQPFTCKRQNADIIWKTNKRIINRESCPGCISDHKEEGGLKTTFHENGTPLILSYLQKHFCTSELEIAGAGTPLEKTKFHFDFLKLQIN